MKIEVDQARIRPLNKGKVKAGPVLCWLSRDQRLEDNWAVLAAQSLAVANNQPLAVVFCLADSFLGATWRQYSFMLAGLRELASDCRDKNISFYLLVGQPPAEIQKLATELSAGAVVCDFSPLRPIVAWQRSAAKALGCALLQVDAHNIVPVWAASDKQEYGAYTLRPKLNRLLTRFLTPMPRVLRHPVGRATVKADWSAAKNSLKIDFEVAPLSHFSAGSQAAAKAATDFLKHRLAGYAKRRNDPNVDGQSALSPFLHFGQLSAQRLAWEVIHHPAPNVDREAFLEELIIRRELADNFCFYQPHYDSPKAFPAWAQKTLTQHQADCRQLISLAKLEAADTKDELWNACQRQLMREGKLHGYLRMYWAKQLLLWRPSAAAAMKAAIYLNDKYELDGRDPNGYAGIAWSLGGVHDRPWFGRPIFGQLRYMSASGAVKKFNVKAFIDKYR